MRRVLFYLCVGMVFMLSACRDGVNKTSHTAIDLELIRFEKELFALDLYSPEEKTRLLLKQYPEFMALYTNRIISIGDTLEPYYSYGLSSFATDLTMYDLYKRVDSVFADLSEQKEIIAEGLANYSDHFPEKPLPVIYTYISGLNQSVVTGDKLLGLSLDKYLGFDEPLYNKVYPPIPLYLKKTMSPEYVGVDAVRAWVTSELTFQPVKNNLLSRMLNEATAMYLTKQVLPNVPDTIIWGFSTDQLQFCVESEDEMWKYLIEQKLLFSSDNMTISKFVEPGPFTKDFTRESPARAVVWLGYRIIESYMSKNKSITLSELASEVDYQRVLNESRYNP